MLKCGKWVDLVFRLHRKKVENRDDQSTSISQYVTMSSMNLKLKKINRLSPGFISGGTSKLVLSFVEKGLLITDTLKNVINQQQKN